MLKTLTTLPAFEHPHHGFRLFIIGIMALAALMLVFHAWFYDWKNFT
jgi:hypothetical protein